MSPKPRGLNFRNLISLAPRLGYDHSLALKLSKRYNRLGIEIIDEYLNSQPQCYINELNEFENINSSFLPSNRRVFIFIPTYNENNNLENLLSQYLTQENFDGTIMDKSLYEICVVINYPAEGKNADSDRKNFEKSVRIVKDFQKRGADNIHFIAKTFPKSLACLGRARKYAMDYSLLRISKGTPEQKMKSILISNEGDTLRVPKHYIASFLRLFEKGDKHFVQGSMEYPSQLTASFSPLSFFTRCREAVHFGMSIFEREFTHYDGILPVGRNFAMHPIIASAVGGIDPIKRKGTDDDLMFGTDISQLLGKEYKSYHPIPLTTNPRREILIVADLMNDGKMDSGKAYSEFHQNMELYNLTIEEVIEIARQNIPPELSENDAPQLLNHYFNWVLRSTAMEHLDDIPGFKDIFDNHFKHKIGYWEKEKEIEKIEKAYLRNLPKLERALRKTEIVSDAINWFNYFCGSLGLRFQCTYEGLESKLCGCNFDG